MNYSVSIYWTDIGAGPSVASMIWLAHLRQIRAFADEFAARHRRGERCAVTIGAAEPPAGGGILSDAAWRIAEGIEVRFGRGARAAQAARVGRRRPAGFPFTAPARR